MPQKLGKLLTHFPSKRLTHSTQHAIEQLPIAFLIKNVGNKAKIGANKPQPVRTDLRVCNTKKNFKRRFGYTQNVNFIVV